MVSPKQTSTFNFSTSIVNSRAPPATFYPESGNLFPKYTDEFPKHAVEVWRFDALAKDGGDAFTVSFFRDNVASPNGFRVVINVSWANGQTWSHDLEVPVSSVINEGEDPSKGFVIGEWRSEEKDGPSAAFQITPDLENAVVSFNIPDKITGSLSLFTKWYRDLPTTEDEANLGTNANIFWMRPMTVAHAHVDVRIRTDTWQQKNMLLNNDHGGYGGMERSWESMPWKKAVTDSLFVRAQVGPFVLNVMFLVGRQEENYPKTTSARLYHNGTLVCAAQRVVDPEHGLSAEQLTKENALVLEKSFDGEGIPATFRSKNTGYKLKFLSYLQWSFELQHEREWWKFPTNKSGLENTGDSTFIVKVKGGSAGSEEVHEGFGMVSQVEMPEYEPGNELPFET